MDIDILREEYKKILKEELGIEKKVVFGEGSKNAKIMLIGEAPGKFEEEMGRPFIGQAGKNLDEFLSILGLNRDDLYITNVVKFRPTKKDPKTQRLSNRAPNKKEIELSKKFLIKEIEFIKPRIIVTLGNVPLKALLFEKASIGEYHGKLINLSDKKIFPLYHPASIIYNRSLYDVYLEDLKKLRKVLEGEEHINGF